MNIKITTADTVNKLISAIVAVLPPIFNKTAGSNVVNTITAFCQAFKINVDQVNQMFNNTFLDCSSGTILDGLIKSYSGLKRKDDESDADYLNRHYKMVYTYNNSNSKATQIVYDITSENPILIRAGSNRSAFWGVANSGYVESASGIAYYYDDIGNYTRFWGDINNSDAFKAYIYLNEKPSGVVLDELCNVLNYVRAAGTTIYLVYPPFNLIEPTATSGVALGLGEFTANYSSVDYATSYYLTIATNPAFSPIEQSNVVSFTNNYTFQGLSNSANYYYKVQAVSGIFQSDFSNSVQVAMRQLSTPTTTASSGLTSGFVANWNIVSGAVNYSLDLSLTSGFVSLIVSNATTSSLTYTFSGLAPNNYFYRVKAVNGVHESQYAISSGTASSVVLPNHLIYSEIVGGYYIPKKVNLDTLVSSALFTPAATTNYRWISYNAVRNRIVYRKNNSVYTANIDGTSETLIAASGDSPIWSFDGQYIFYSGNSEQRVRRYEVDTATDISLFTSAVGVGVYYLHTPANTTTNKISFNDYYSAIYDIYTCNFDGSGLTNIFDNSAYYEAAFNPSGNQLSLSTEAPSRGLTKSNINGSSPSQYVSAKDYQRITYLDDSYVIGTRLVTATNYTTAVINKVRVSDGLETTIVPNAGNYMEVADQPFIYI